MRILDKVLKVVIGIVLLSIAACASHPLGIPDEEWTALNSQQKFEARKKQAALDLKARELAVEREKRRNAERIVQRQEEYDQDIANGLIAEFYPQDYACFGGDKCRRNRDEEKRDEIVIPLHALSNIDVIQIYADDRVGSKHEGVLGVSADRFKVKKIDLSDRTKWHQIFVGRTARNIVLKAETDDEIRVFRVKVFGSRIPNNQLKYNIIEQ